MPTTPKAMRHFEKNDKGENRKPLNPSHFLKPSHRRRTSRALTFSDSCPLQTNEASRTIGISQRTKGG